MPTDIMKKQKLEGDGQYHPEKANTKGLEG